MNPFHLFIATPNKVIFDGQVYSLLAPGASGYLEVLAHHAPLITTLKEGKLEVTDTDKKVQQWTVTGGYLEVMKNEATLLLDEPILSL